MGVDVRSHCQRSDFVKLMANSQSLVVWIFGALLAADGGILLIMALWLGCTVAVTRSACFGSKLDLREILFQDVDHSKVVRKILMYGSRRDNPCCAGDHPQDYRWLRTVCLVPAAVAAPFQPAAQAGPVAQAAPAAQVERPDSGIRTM